MERKMKVIGLFLTILVIGGTFISVSAENNQTLQEQSINNVKYKFLKGRFFKVAYFTLVRAGTYYTLNNGVNDTVEGTLLGYKNGFLIVEINDENTILLSSPKFSVEGQIKTIIDLKDWKDKEADIEFVKIDIVGKNTRTIRVVTSINVDGMNAVAVYQKRNE
jgi:hypothetical protein